MQAKKIDERREDRHEGIADLIALSRLNYALYVVILLVGIIITYYVIAEYITYSGLSLKEDLSVEILTNEPQSFADGFHPVIVIATGSKEPSIIRIKLSSPGYTAPYTSGEYVENYTALAILPKEMFSKVIDIGVTATDESGVMYTKILSVKTPDEPKVVFGVQ